MAINDLQEFLFGGGATQVPANASPIEKFLHVVAHGIDWQADVKARSSYDFAAHVDFDALLVQCPDVFERYLDYVRHHVLEKVENDPSFAGATGYDDSIVDAIAVLERIVDASRGAGVEPKIAPDQAQALLGLCDQMEGLMEGEGADEADFEAFTSLRAFIGGLTANPPRSLPGL